MADNIDFDFFDSPDDNASPVSVTQSHKDDKTSDNNKFNNTTTSHDKRGNKQRADLHTRTNMKKDTTSQNQRHSRHRESNYRNSSDNSSDFNSSDEDSTTHKKKRSAKKKKQQHGNSSSSSCGSRKSPLGSFSDDGNSDCPNGTGGDKSYSKYSSSDEDDAKIAVYVHSNNELEAADYQGRSTKSRRYTSRNDNASRKPPLPSSSSASAWQEMHNKQVTKAHNALTDKDSLSLLAPGSTYYAPDGRKMKKGRCRYSDKEVSASNSSSSDEEEIRRTLNNKSRRKQNSDLKLGLGDLASPRSRSSNSRSRSNSSEWSTGRY